MKGGIGPHWWLTIFLLQTAFMPMSYSAANNCGESGSAILGLFDDNDNASISKFRSTLEDLNAPGCQSKFKRKELLLNNQMSAMEAINATRGAFLGENVCYVIYSSYSSIGRLALDIALSNGIPVVSTLSKKAYHSKEDHSRYFYDPAKVISLHEKGTRLTKVNVTLDYILEIKWKKLIAITGADIDDINVVSALRQEIGRHNVEIDDWLIIPNIGEQSEVIYRALTKLLELRDDATNFLLITNEMTLAGMIFDASDQININTGRTYQWLLISDMNLEVISKTWFSVSSDVTFIIHPLPEEEFNNSDYVEDAIALLKISLKEWTTHSSEGCPSITEIQRHLPQIEFSGKTGMVKFDTEGQRLPSAYIISLAQHRCPLSPPDISEIGYWKAGKLDIIGSGEATHLKIIINEYAPNVMSQPKLSPEEPCASNAISCYRIVRNENGDESKENEKCCYGFVIDSIKMMRDSMNFIPELIFSEDGKYGVPGENGSWDGIVNDLLTGKGDMSPDLFASSQRAEVIDFTEPYMPAGIVLLTKELKRQQKQIYWSSYMRPFTAPVWYLFAGAVGAMIVFLWIVDKFSPSRADRKILHWQTPFGLDNAVCYALQLAFGRPADEKKPRTNGGRLASVIFGLAMMIIMASYSANLAAFLIVNDKTTPVINIYDGKIGKPPPHFKYGTLEGSYMANYFKSNENQYFRKIWKNMKKNNVKSLSEGVKKVRSGELDVFIADTIGLQYESLNDPYCELKVVGEAFAMTGCSMAVKKGSPWLEKLSTEIGKLKAKGLTDFIQRFWVKKFSCNRESPPVQLEMEDLSGLFLQLLIAILLCGLGVFFHVRLVHLSYQQCKGEERADENESLELQMDTHRPVFAEPEKETCI